MTDTKFHVYPEDFDNMCVLRTHRYGQMTAGSYCYIGPQGIVHGTTVCISSYHPLLFRQMSNVFGDGALTIKYSARNTAFHSIKHLVEERIAQEFCINFNNPLPTIRIAFCKTLTHYIHNLQCGSHIYNCWQIKCKKDRQTVISNYVFVFYF